MVAECLSQSTIQATDANSVESDPIDPNQLTIDQQVADVSETEIQLPDGRVIDELDAAEPMNEIVEIDEEDDFDFTI